MPQTAAFENIVLRPVTDGFADRSFIKTLFSFADVKRNFTLRADHAADIFSFVSYMDRANRTGSGVHSIIERKDGDPVGLITAEPYENAEGKTAWNIGFAIHPLHRNKGYAKDAVNGIAFILSRYPIKTMDLDICLDNDAAEAVARACGCEQLHSPTGGIVGFMDPEHPELGMRSCWIRDVQSRGKRDEYGNEAIKAHKEKDYRSAITYYKEALKEPYSPGSSFTDAIIYSNMGMAYSSMRRHAKAYALLKKAWDMGCRNQTVSKELEWLETNAPAEICRKDATELLEGIDLAAPGRLRLKPAFRKEMMLDYQRIVKDNKEVISIITMQAETIFVALGHLNEILEDGGVSMDVIQNVADQFYNEAKAVTMDLFPIYGERPNNDGQEWYEKGKKALVVGAFGQDSVGWSARAKSFLKEYRQRLNKGEQIEPIYLVHEYLD